MKKILIVILFIFSLFLIGCSENVTSNTTKPKEVTTKEKEITTKQITTKEVTTKVITSTIKTTNITTEKEDDSIKMKDFLQVHKDPDSNRYFMYNQDDEKVILRGPNFGGWLLTESWMTLTNTSCQKELINILTDRFGEEECENLLNIYYDNFILDIDFDRVKELGLNCIRIPFWYRNLTDEEGNILPNAFERLDWAIENAKKRGLYVILDLHGAIGSQNGNDHSGDVSGHHLFDANENGELYRTMTVRLWKLIAKHYKDEPTVAMYDILNEPTNGGLTGSTQWALFDRIYQAIREVDPNHIICMESCWDAQDLPSPRMYNWENICYQYHQYLFDKYDDVDAQVTSMRNKINNVLSKKYGAAILIGEFCMFNKKESWEQAFNMLNQNELCWTTWTYKVTGSGSNNWGLYNIKDVNIDINTQSLQAIKNIWTRMSEDNTSVVKNYVLCSVIKKYSNGQTD